MKKDKKTKKTHNDQQNTTAILEIFMSKISDFKLDSSVSEITIKL
jgi:hypothetical protein